MALPDKINPDELDIDIVSDNDDISTLNCRESDSTDPLGVQDFLETKAQIYSKNNLTSLWRVKYKGKIVAFFSLSMSSIGLDDVPRSKQVKEMTARYPALLIGQMGVDKNYRGRKIGDAICKHCIGLARKFNERIACACITLQTTEDKASYYQQYFFETTRKLRNGQVAMYLSTT
ncbi:MAG: GNAT family N-acetyltransferase [Thaumarchaeota archaeon]|nr:GNAT family N-acetyltransferase [Nitrososphaerota archaeon]